jgi:hypothetical protein
MLNQEVKNKLYINLMQFMETNRKMKGVHYGVDKYFNIDDYVMYSTPMHLNRLIPGTFESEKSFDRVMTSVDIIQDGDIRRRNRYLNGVYKNIPIRLCIGDRFAEHVPGRYPMWLNVVIIHRSGIVSGSWYEDDKFLYQKEYKHSKLNYGGFYNE